MFLIDIDLNKFIGTVLFLFAIANPIGVIPVFLSLTSSETFSLRHKIIITASIAFAIFFISAVLIGKQILIFFNIGLNDFRITGGLLMLFIAFNMFQARYSRVNQTKGENEEAEENIKEIAITPLAFPMLAGPAELSMLMTYASDAKSWSYKILLIFASIIVAFLIALVLWAALPIEKLIGKTGINISTRITALIVASIGISFIMTGIKNEFPMLAGI